MARGRGGARPTNVPSIGQSTAAPSVPRRVVKAGQASNALDTRGGPVPTRLAQQARGGNGETTVNSTPAKS